MQLNIKGIAVQVDDNQIASIVLQHFTGNGISVIPRVDLHSINVPPLGSIWTGQGGIFTGLVRGRDGQPDYLVITGSEIDQTTWEKAKSAAAALEIDGHKDFSLPFRAEQALQFANVPELFEKEWYWSCEQLAAGPGYAWVQLFGNGSQGLGHQSDVYRARAVRRLIIQ
jgi:hypothetical protein